MAPPASRDEDAAAATPQNCLLGHPCFIIRSLSSSLSHTKSLLLLYLFAAAAAQCQMPDSPTLHQEPVGALPFLQQKTAFVIVNEPVVDSHVASNLLHQLLYALQVPNDRVLLLDELLLQGSHNASYAALLPFLLHAHQQLSASIEFIYVGSAYSRVVPAALEHLIEKLSRVEEEQREQKQKKFKEKTEKQQPQWKTQQRKKGNGDGQEKVEEKPEEDRSQQLVLQQQENPPLEPLPLLREDRGFCIGFGLRDAQSSIRHHFYSDKNFHYPFLPAGMLMNRRFLHFLSEAVERAATSPIQHQQNTSTHSSSSLRLPLRIEIDPVHELFRSLYELDPPFLLLHSDLFCPYNPTPVSHDRTEAPYPAAHHRIRCPVPAATLEDIFDKSKNKSKNSRRTSYDLKGESRNGRISRGEDARKLKSSNGPTRENNDIRSGNTQQRSGSEEHTSQPVDGGELVEQALRAAEEQIKECVSFVVGSRHSPILSHQFFDRLMSYEEEKVERKEELTRRFPINAILEGDEELNELEEKLLRERPFFIVEPEDVLVAVKTHPANIRKRIPIIKELWASPAAAEAMAERRARQGGKTQLSHDAFAAEEMRNLKDNMSQFRVQFFSEKPSAAQTAAKASQAEDLQSSLTPQRRQLQAEKVQQLEMNMEQQKTQQSEGKKLENEQRPDSQQTARKKQRSHVHSDDEEVIWLHDISHPGEKRALCEKMLGIMRHFFNHYEKRRFLVIVDDDSLVNVRHLLDIISMTLQPPIPARIFFRQALTDRNGLRQAHEPYKALARAVDRFMHPWKEQYAVSSEAATAGVQTSAAATPEQAETARTKATQVDTEGSHAEGVTTTEQFTHATIREQRREKSKARPSEEIAAFYSAKAYVRKPVTSTAAAAQPADKEAPAASSPKKTASKSSSTATAALPADRISPLYAGERYSFGHTAAALPVSTGKHEPEEPIKSKSPRNFFGGGGYDYITGGGGIVLDREAVHAILKCKDCRCPADGTADDMILGLWMKRLLVPAVHLRGFHQERPAAYHAVHLRTFTPVSFHRLDTDEAITKKEFAAQLDVGEGLNIGRYEEDDYQALDWVDFDWQQVEDILWNEFDDGIDLFKKDHGDGANELEDLDFQSILDKVIKENEKDGFTKHTPEALAQKLERKAREMEREVEVEARERRTERGSVTHDEL